MRPTSLHARMARSPAAQTAAPQGVQGSLADGGLAGLVVFVVLLPGFCVTQNIGQPIHGALRGARPIGAAVPPLACLS